MRHEGSHLWRAVGEHATAWVVGGVLLAATGFAPEEWLARTVHGLHIPESVLHLWAAGVDVRVVPIAIGVVVIAVGLLRQHQALLLAPSSGPPVPRAGPAGTTSVNAASVTKTVDQSLVQGHPDQLPLPDRPSIAVLPFANLSGDPEQEYFSDGVADDIITELSRDRALFVIARNSSFTYRGRSIDVKQVGRELGVRYVVEGSVRRETGRVRVSAQLIDAMTGDHIWADRYDRALEHVFAVQDEITEAVTTAIRPAVGGAEQRRVLRKPPGSLSAWETYQRGLWHLAKGTSEGTEQARVLFEEAAKMDPAFASAFAGLAWTHIRDAVFHGTRPFVEAAAMAQVEARKAVALDPNDSEAQATLALAFRAAGDANASLDCAERALSLNRNSAAAHYAKGAAVMMSGQFAEGRINMTTSLRLNPRDPISPMAAGGIPASYYLERDYEKAVEAARRCLADYPAYAPPRRWLVAALGQLGRLGEAAAALHDFDAVAPHTLDARVHNRPPYIRSGDQEHMLDGLRKAGWQE